MDNETKARFQQLETKIKEVMTANKHLRSAMEAYKRRYVDAMETIKSIKKKNEEMKSAASEKVIE